MNFLNPLLLWVAVPLGGLIVLLYMMRMRRQEMRVPAIFLWPDRTEEVRANTFFQRPRFSWLMVLQLLVLVVMILGLARPQQRKSGLAGEVTVFVLDASASMGATDAKPTRFDRGRDVIAAAVRAMEPGERIAVIEAGPEPRVVFPLQNDPARQLRALDAMVRSDAEVNLTHSLQLAAALVSALPNATIVLVSDGAGEPVKDFSSGKAEFLFQSVGTDNANLRVSALGVSDSSKGRLAYVEIQNTGGRLLKGKVSIFADDTLADSEQISVASGGVWGKTVAVPRTSRFVRAKVEAPDLLAADNERTTLANPGANLRVLLVTKGNLFLERALGLDPRVTLDRSREVPQSERGHKGAPGGVYDVVVFDDEPEVPVKAAGVLNFGATGSPWVKSSGTVPTTQAGLDEKVALMAGVDLAGVYFGVTQKLTPQRGARSVVDSEGGALIVQAPGAVVTAFTPLESDFPLQFSFPIFIANALDHLAQSSGSELRAIRPGQVFAVPATSVVEVTGPDTRTSVEPMDGSAVIRGIRRVGQFSLRTDKRTQTVFSSLVSESESDITPKETFQTGTARVQSAKSPDRFVDFIQPLLALLLVLVGCEWWLFVRKS